MENIILSLLLIKSMTIYEISTFIQRNLTTVCSSSFGSIQTALKKLMSKDCIEYTEYMQSNILKKEYRIKEAGLDQFNNWIRKPMNLQKVKSMEEGKFFFLGMADKQTRINSLRSYIESMESEQVKFKEIKKMVEMTKDNVIEKNVERIQLEENLEQQLLKVSGETELSITVQNIYNYQLYNLEYALNRIKEDIEFYSMILKREEDGK